MISAFRAQGEHTTGTARAGAWQRTRGPFAIDIPEPAGAGVCLLLPCPRLRGARAGIQAAACPRQVLLLPRVQEEKGSFAVKERYHPWSTAVLGTGEGQERGGGRKATGSGRIPAPYPCKDLFWFLAGLLCFPYPSALWDELPSLPVPCPCLAL